MELDPVEQRIVELLKVVPERAKIERWPDGRWTPEITRELCQLASKLDFFPCAVGAHEQFGDYRGHGEWLFDVTWLQYEPPAWSKSPETRLVEVPLVLECEWSSSDDEVLDDFEKLLCARAQRRVMIFQRRDDASATALISRLKERVRGFRPTRTGDRYLFAAYLYERDGFLFDQHVQP